MSLKTIWMLRTITMRADGDPGRIARIDAFFGIFSVFGLEHGLRFIKEDAQRTDLPRMGPFYSETSGATLRYVLVNLFSLRPVATFKLIYAPWWTTGLGNGRWARMQRVQPNGHRAEGKNASEIEGE